MNHLIYLTQCIFNLIWTKPTENDIEIGVNYTFNDWEIINNQDVHFTEPVWGIVVNK